MRRHKSHIHACLREVVLLVCMHPSITIVTVNPKHNLCLATRWVQGETIGDTVDIDDKELPPELQTLAMSVVKPADG